MGIQESHHGSPQHLDLLQHLDTPHQLNPPDNPASCVLSGANMENNRLLYAWWRLPPASALVQYQGEMYLIHLNALDISIDEQYLAPPCSTQALW